MYLPYTWLDVFAARHLEGNQLCVFSAPAGLPESAMQALTRELGHSETTFLQPPTMPEADARLRIFIPTGGSAVEVPFAGHPILGSACAFAFAGSAGAGAVQALSTVRLETGAGLIPVAVQVTGQGRWQARMSQPLPQVTALPGIAPAAVAAMLGLPAEAVRQDLPVEAVDNGMQTVIIPMASLASVQQARPDLPALAAAFGRRGNCVLLFALGAVTPGADVHVRVFSPFDQVSEDPATGSANGPLGEYLVRHSVLPGPHILSEQGLEIGRPSRMAITVERSGACTTAVWVGGEVVWVGQGEFALPISER